MLRPGPSSLSLSDPAGKTARVPVSMRATGGGMTLGRTARGEVCVRAASCCCARLVSPGR